MIGDDGQTSNINVDSNLLNSILVSNDTAQLQMNLSSFPSNSIVQFQVAMCVFITVCYIFPLT